MIKFLRRYQKWLLAILGTTLMILFLLPSASMFQSANEGRREIAKLASGRVLRMSDRSSALSDLTILSALTPDPLFGKDPKENADRWMLMLAEAESLGLDATPSQVETALVILDFVQRDADGKSLNKVNEVELGNRAAKLGTNPAGVRAALKHFLKVAALRELVSGSAWNTEYSRGFATPGLKRLITNRSAGEAAEDLNRLRNDYMTALMSGNRSQLAQLENQAHAITMRFRVPDGAIRLSDPSLILAQSTAEARVGCRVLELPARAQVRVDGAAAPTEDELATLLTRYNNAARGKSDYGLGYLIPPRVRMEAVGVPITEARRLVEAELNPEDIRTFYDANSGEFPAGGLTQATRKLVKERLINQRAAEKAADLLKAASAVLNPDIKSAATGNAFVPTPLAEVAQALRSAGVEPTEMDEARIAEACTASEAGASQELSFYGAQDRWITLDAMDHHPIFGQKAGQRPQATAIKFPQVTPTMLLNHVAQPEKATPALPLGLSVAARLPLPLFRAENGSAWLLRITAAEDAHPPKNIDEVRPWLVRDAKALAAYRQLVANKDNLLANAALVGLEKIGGPGEAPVVLPDITRAAMSEQNPETPCLRWIFDEAEKLATLHPDFRDSKPAERLLAFADDKTMTLRLFELGHLIRPPQSAHAMFAANPVSHIQAQDLLEPKTSDPTSLEAIKARLGVTWSGGKE